MWSQQAINIYVANKILANLIVKSQQYLYMDSFLSSRKVTEQQQCLLEILKYNALHSLGIQSNL